MRFSVSLPVKVVVVFAAALLFPLEVSAQIAEDNTLQAIVDGYQVIGRTSAPALVAAMHNTFWLLATIELTVSLAFEALKQSGVQGVIATLVHRIMFIGFFSYLMLNGFNIAESILNGFLDLGQNVVSVKLLTPDNVLDTGIELAKKITEGVAWWNVSKFGYLVIAVIMLICFAAMAGAMVLALVEFYVVVFAGIFLLGFGGSTYTKDYALMFIKAVVMVGLKVFILMILSGIGIGIIHGYAANITNNSGQYLSLLGSSVVLAILINRAPDLLASLVTGVSHSGGGGVSATTNAVGGAAKAVGGAAMSTGGIGAAIYQAGKVGASQPGSTAVNTAKSLGKAFYQDVKSVNAGSASAFPGSTRGARMASSIKASGPSISKGGGNNGGGGKSASGGDNGGGSKSAGGGNNGGGSKR